MLSNEIVTFAGNNTDLYEATQRYFQFENERTPENNKKLNDAFFAEIERMTGVSRNNVDPTAWAQNPSVKWACFAIVDAMINAIIPVTILPQFGMFVDFRTLGYGDVLKIRVKPKQFYTVSLSGRGERTTFRQKHFENDVTIDTVQHIVTVYVDMYRVLTGKEDIAEAVRLVLLSVEQEMYRDALNTLNTGLAAITDTALKVSGAFDMKTLIRVAERVQVLNGGAKPVLLGSSIALMNILPDSTLGYRMNVDGNGGAIQLMKNVLGFDIVKLDPALAADGTLLMPEDKIYIISPAMDKLLKGVMSTAMNNSNEFYDNADLTQNFTYRKDWGFAFVTAASCGVYTITTE